MCVPVKQKGYHHRFAHSRHVFHPTSILIAPFYVSILYFGANLLFCCVDSLEPITNNVFRNSTISNFYISSSISILFSIYWVIFSGLFICWGGCVCVCVLENFWQEFFQEFLRWNIEQDTRNIYRFPKKIMRRIQ